MSASEVDIEKLRSELKCRLCDHGGARLRFRKKERLFWRCRNCGLEMQHPLPTKEELQAYYDASYQCGLYTEFSAAMMMKKSTAKRRFDELSRVVSGQRWLDVGASNGTFVKYLVDRSMDASGIELSETAAQQAQAEGVPVRVGTLADYEDDPPYDVVCAFDILEHMLDPIIFMEQVHAAVKPQGYVVITVPDLGSIHRMLMGSHWYFYIPEEHLYYFDRKTVPILMRKTGFELVSISRTFKPLTFDYTLTQLKEYNPSIYKILAVFGNIMPKFLRQAVIPIYIGEMMVIARRN